MNILDSPTLEWQDEDMPHIFPQYGRSRVNWAGKVLISPVIIETDRAEALQIVNNWRPSHGYPLFGMRLTLSNRAKQVDAHAVIVQRIKRLPAIINKLNNEPSMKLSQMQDIGGCRAIVHSVPDVLALRALYRTRPTQHEFAEEYDYIAQPKASGYRSVHLVYRYSSDKEELSRYNRLKIEIQLRSRLQHAWATAVETVDTFTQQSLKASRGTAEWTRFFVLMGSALALREKTRLVLGTPTTEREISDELRHYAQTLDVESALRGFGAALDVPRLPAVRGAGYYLLQLVPRENQLYVTPFGSRERERATNAYLEAELSLSAKGPGAQIVLVSAESVSALKRAYPNYFLDTRPFLRTLGTIIGNG